MEALCSADHAPAFVGLLTLRDAGRLACAARVAQVVPLLLAVRRAPGLHFPL